MAWIKALHVIAVFIWIGSLMTLTRFMGYHVKECCETQMRLAKLYHRIYRLVQFPTMMVAIVLGLVLAAQYDFTVSPTWMFVKLSAAMGLIMCDFACGRMIGELNREPDLTRGSKYKMLHGFTGLLLIAIVISATVVRDRGAEEVHKYLVKTGQQSEAAQLADR